MTNEEQRNAVWQRKLSALTQKDCQSVGLEGNVSISVQGNGVGVGSKQAEERAMESHERAIWEAKRKSRR